MRRYICTILFAFLSYAASAQTTQILGAPGTRIATKGDMSVDSIFYLPRTLVTSRSPAQAGALRYQASDSSLYQWTGTQWVKVVGGIFSVAGQTNYLPKYTSSSTLGNSAMYDSSGYIRMTTNNIGGGNIIDNPITGMWLKKNGRFGFPLLVQQNDSLPSGVQLAIGLRKDLLTSDKPSPGFGVGHGMYLRDDANTWKLAGYISANITDSTATNYTTEIRNVVNNKNTQVLSLVVRPDSTIRVLRLAGSGTRNVVADANGDLRVGSGSDGIDSVLFATRAWRQKGIDSVSANIAGKVNISDTATMLSPYVRIAGTGLTKSTQTLSADTVTLATRLRVQKAVDSLGSVKQNTLTNPVTGTGTTNYVSKFTGTSAIGNSQIFDDGTNVGIRTTSPARPLDVNGKTRSTDYGMTNNTLNYYHFDNFTGNNFMGLPAANTLGIYVGGGERMRITAAGRLLVGTTTEGTNTVDIAGNLRTTTGANFATSSGNVGIGTESPAAKLDIVGADPGTQIAIRNWPMLNVNGTALNYGGVNVSQWQTLNFFTAGTNRVTFASTGNVGIGTTSPSEVLHVVGRGRFTTIDSTSSPINVLTSDVNGVIRKTSLTGAGGVRGGGTANRVPRFTQTDSIGNSNIYISSNGAGFGLNDPNPTQITSYGTLNLAGSAGAVQYFKIADTIRGYFGMAATTIGQPYTSSVFEMANSTNGDITFTLGTTKRMTLKNDGELLLNSTGGDNGNFLLQVNGNAYVQSETILGATGDLGAYTLQVTGDAIFDGAIVTQEPGGGITNKIPWKLGNVNTVSPTSPNRTITVLVNGTTYYIHAKTTND